MHKRHIEDSVGGNGSITGLRGLEDIECRPFLIRRVEALRLQIEHGPVTAFESHQLVVGAELDDAPVFEAILKLLRQYDEATESDPEDRRRISFLMMALTVARTPDVPIPAGFA